MGSFSLWHWLVVGVIVILLFGKGRFSDMMGDVAKGIKSFKKGMSEDDDALHPVAPPPPARIDALNVPRSNAERDVAPVAEERPL